MFCLVCVTTSQSSETERRGFYFKYSEHGANIDNLYRIMKFTDNESRVDFRRRV